MGKMAKKDWQRIAENLKIKFQKNDTVARLKELIGLELGTKVKKGQSVDSIVKAYIEEMKSEKKGKTKSAKKPKTPTVSNNSKTVKFDEILDDKKRDSVLITVGKKESWLKRDLVKVNKTKSEITMPKYLADVKGL
jgi:hypothetical protein